MAGLSLKAGCEVEKNHVGSYEFSIRGINMPQVAYTTEAVFKVVEFTEKNVIFQVPFLRANRWSCDHTSAPVRCFFHSSLLQGFAQKVQLLTALLVHPDRFILGQITALVRPQYPLRGQ